MPSINISIIKIKILRSTENLTQGCWVSSKYAATSVLCSPPNYILIIVLNNGVLSRPTTWPASMFLQTQWSIDSIDVWPSENLLYLPTKLGPKSKKAAEKNFHHVRFRMSKIWDSENTVFLRPKSTFASNQLYSRHFGWGALSAEILG